MQALAAIIFDFDGVLADSRLGVLLPGAVEFVRAAARVVPLGIASGAHTREIDEILAANQLRSAFAAVVGADQTRRNKPSPDPYLEALHRIVALGHSVQAHHTVAIDDSIWGLVAAATAKMCCVGIADEQRRAEVVPHAELVVPSLGALSLDTLDTLVQASGRRR
jgi:beta-phosphoglucomutase-like phosphatase (HAD superfamily)